MSSLQYFNEKGAGQDHSDHYHYSQCVIIGDTVKCAGQGGWDNDGNLDSEDWKGQIDNAFDNVDRVLQAAGLRGWQDVYLVRSYQLDIANHIDYLVGKLKERMPEHRPIWTALSVPKLALPGMTVEIEVEAYCGKQ
ncbi:YjgF-like protein [Aureobasidium subglaciale]|nr:YjgF-like protein [Aureobasidium subglaciale]